MGSREKLLGHIARIDSQVALLESLPIIPVELIIFDLWPSDAPALGVLFEPVALHATDVFLQPFPFRVRLGTSAQVG